VNNKASLLIKENITALGGVAVDWIHNLVYWTDYGGNRIEVVQLLNV
jgi:hypothetical protein